MKKSTRLTERPTDGLTWRGSILSLLALAAATLFMAQIAAADTVLTPIPVGTGPTQAYLSPAYSKLYVIDSSATVSCPYPAGDVSVVDTNTNAVVATVFVGVNPGPTAFTPDGSRAYVVNRSDCDPTGSVAVIAVPPSILITTVPVGELPVAVTASSDGAKVYVANKGSSSGSISVICTGLVPGVCSMESQVISTISLNPLVAVHPHTLALNPSGSELWVGEEDCPALVGCTSSNIAVISTATDSVITNITVGPKVGVIRFTPDGSRAYAVTEGDPSLSIAPTVTDINASTHAVTTPISITPTGFPTGAWPYDLRITPDAAKVYVADRVSSDVAVICTGKVPAVCSATDSVLSYIPVAAEPVAIEITDMGGRAYVVSERPVLSTGIVSVICTGLVPCGGPAGDTVMSTLTVGNFPVDIALKCSTNTAYVVNQRSSDVSVISLEGAAICGVGDSDYDTVINSVDNCPNWPNLSQVLPPWSVPAGDPDCDGFTSAREAFVGTNATDACGVAAWPADNTEDNKVGLADILAYIPVFGATGPNPPYNKRFDLNADNLIGLSDVLMFIPVFNQTCTP
jgi:DNA-binding beta-propeller fold protein YncE